MTYPLEAGGIGDYPVRVGSMLLTMVDPHQGYEKAYNRWYERDHYYAGCMIGPWLFAGSRWVATRELKDARWPADSKAVADPIDHGSYVAIYWVEKGHHADHFDDWARPQVADLYRDGRGFPKRTHTHTALFDYRGSSYRDGDPVPTVLALDHGYGGLVILWWDATSGSAADLLSALGEYTDAALAGSPVEIAAAFTPCEGEEEVRKQQPMDLGSMPGGPERLVQLLFVHGDVRAALPAVQAYTDAVTGAGLATLALAAPWHRTVVGTDTYVDQLW